MKWAWLMVYSLLGAVILANALLMGSGIFKIMHKISEIESHNKARMELEFRIRVCGGTLVALKNIEAAFDILRKRYPKVDFASGRSHWLGHFRRQRDSVPAIDCRMENPDLPIRVYRQSEDRIHPNWFFSFRDDAGDEDANSDAHGVAEDADAESEAEGNGLGEGGEAFRVREDAESVCWGKMQCSWSDGRCRVKWSRRSCWEE
jgi:hypothetical protein